MPRYDGNTPASHRSRNHKPMHSARHGRGGDAKIKEEKQIAGKSRQKVPAKKRHYRNEEDPA